MAVFDYLVFGSYVGGSGVSFAMRGFSTLLLLANESFSNVFAGTTCATILTRAIFSEGCKSVAAGMNAMDLRRGISMAVDSVVTNLKSRARMISTSEEIAQVGTISANGEREIGELIAKAMEKVGKEGVITIQVSCTMLMHICFSVFHYHAWNRNCYSCQCLSTVTKNLITV